MSKGTLDDHNGPWTEADWLALGETNNRIELIDGSLWVSPAPNRPHQHISSQLWSLLDSAARTVGLRAFQATNLRVSPDLVLIPDLVVDAGPPIDTIGDATDVALVCEITSPSNASADRILKRAFYAAAAIPWYLLVEPDFSTYESVTLFLYRLDGKAYVEHATAKQGETLTSELPFPIAISTEALLDF
ncbi:Uma2 family endonuclease [Actinoplanes awajinensis]|uniref:Putative restriction endonuclease domain-containing protein n=1 Tax=Actinoplanes awajinensis subsp. mycoplanecinus TaxID=135947 RepID=A0A101JUM0_9ACTN|nr:Uma2 family endonuclease [Actinoplanes awajinensis]KUL33350.1 hypothetical protein ADL15_17815 [Actinoplanes awajinensis subsp. mycoplanecinus]